MSTIKGIGKVMPEFTLEVHRNVERFHSYYSESPMCITGPVEISYECLCPACLGNKNNVHLSGYPAPSEMENGIKIECPICGRTFLEKNEWTDGIYSSWVENQKRIEEEHRHREELERKAREERLANEAEFQKKYGRAFKRHLKRLDEIRLDIESRREEPVRVLASLESEDDEHRSALILAARDKYGQDFAERLAAAARPVFEEEDDYDDY